MGKDNTAVNWYLTQYYNFENHLSDGRMAEKPVARVMYDIRKISEYIKELGRPLTEVEAQQFIN